MKAAYDILQYNDESSPLKNADMDDLSKKLRGIYGVPSTKTREELETILLNERVTFSSAKAKEIISLLENKAVEYGKGNLLYFQKTPEGNFRISKHRKNVHE